jgi:hypothetical protein
MSRPGKARPVTDVNQGETDNTFRGVPGEKLITLCQVTARNIRAP